jgi:hypothetical protein
MLQSVVEVNIRHLRFQVVTITKKVSLENPITNVYTFRVNSDHKIGSRLKIGQNLQFTNTHNTAPNTTSSQTGLLWSAIRFHPGLTSAKC